MKKNQVTIEQFAAAINTAEKRWFDSRDAATVAKGIERSVDLNKARKMLTPHTVEYLNRVAADASATVDAIANTLPVKATMRMVEFLNAVHAGDYRALDVVTTLSMLSYAYAGVTSREGLHFASTGKGDEMTSERVKNTALVRKLQNALGRVGASTEPTQLSRSFGKNGFCASLGVARIAKIEGQKQFETDIKHPLFLAVSKLIETATDSTLDLMVDKKRAKASK